MKPLSAKARACLVSYDWPGNVRELENAMERALVLGSSDSILPDDLPEAVLEAGSLPAATAANFHGTIRSKEGAHPAGAAEREWQLHRSRKCVGDASQFTPTADPYPRPESRSQSWIAIARNRLSFRELNLGGGGWTPSRSMSGIAMFSPTRCLLCSIRDTNANCRVM